jgi:ParB family transcriptional regulator, chromosome partitioning protein
VNKGLHEIDVDLIDRNPENPRIVFRSREMALLMDSIRQHGVQVPIAVFRQGRRYVLIDGERRWKACIKLNKEKIPALVQDKPDALTNLLLMFNIHALREQWDLLTIALKLPRVIELLRARTSREPNEGEIAAETGLIRAVVRRARLLMQLPDKYQQMILLELKKPKQKQKLTEDFFIEMERSLTTVERNMPDVLQRFKKEEMRDILIEKYRSGRVANLVHLRQIARIARAKRVNADTEKAQHSLEKLFSSPSYTIERAYEESVGFAYGERDLATRVAGLTQQLKLFEGDDLDDEIIEALRDLSREIKKILGAQ